MSRVQKVCKYCGSEQVFVDGWIRWNVETQKHDTIESVFENAFCASCDGNIVIVEKDEHRIKNA